ncbi:hypothetical protein CIU17_19120 [Salmonella enterica]|nr:hypothetical protein [Salmonella enterica]
MGDTFTASILSVYAGTGNRYAVPPAVDTVIDVVVTAMNGVFECVAVTAYGALFMSKKHVEPPRFLVVENRE